MTVARAYRGTVVFVNRGEFGSVFTTLLTNAAEAMKRGGEITVGLSTRTFDDTAASAQGVSAGSYVCVTVTDEGIGVIEDVSVQVFDPFFTTKSADRCTGLGLSIAYDQVHGWSGRITAESTYGEGSTFEVLIPRRELAIPQGYAPHSIGGSPGRYWEVHPHSIGGSPTRHRRFSGRCRWRKRCRGSERRRRDGGNPR